MQRSFGGRAVSIGVLACLLTISSTTSSALTQQRNSDADLRQSSRLDIICVARSNGQVRIVDSRGDCRNNEFVIDLDELRGPAGPTGPQGAQGAEGAQGAPGAPGAQGPAGKDGANGAPGAAGPTGAQGPSGKDGADGAQGPTGAQGPAGKDGATGEQGPAGPAGAAATVRAANREECEAGGVIVSDGKTEIPVCHGRTGATGATGAMGSQGPQGPQGPGGAGVAVVDEESTAMVPSPNLRVTVNALPSFRPLAVSRVGFDVAIAQPGGDEFQVHAVTYTMPPIKLMLAGDAPFNALRTLWQSALDGAVVTVSLQIDLHIPTGFLNTVDVWHLNLSNAAIVGFNDGQIAPASLTVQPAAPSPATFQLTKGPATAAQIEAAYGNVGMAAVQTPGITVGPSTRMMGVARMSGGEASVSGLGGQPVRSDLHLTLTADTPWQVVPDVDVLAFDVIYEWIDDVLAFSSDAQRTLVVTPNVGVPTSLTDVVPSRINLINPLLRSNSTFPMVPYVFDLRLRLQ